MAGSKHEQTNKHAFARYEGVSRLSTYQFHEHTNANKQTNKCVSALKVVTYMLYVLVDNDLIARPFPAVG